MTTRGQDDDLRDARFDTAWRAASNEAPPAALDDAIRAAARREIGTGPRRADARVPEALRPERWWWPLAAAATIGAIAIGLLQLSGPDNVGTPEADKGIVSDTPAAPAKTQKQDAAPMRDEVQKATAPALAQSAPAGSDDARGRAAPAQPRTAAAPALRKDAAAAPPRDERVAANAAPAPPPARLEASRQEVESPRPASPPAAEPFPADAAKRESKEAVAGAVAPSPAAAVTPAAPPAEAKAGFASSKRAALPATVRAQESAGARAPAPVAAGAMADATSDARAKVAPKLPVPDWIVLIRKLRDEGRIDEAAKELAAFRAAYADHELLLPPDLRDWKPVPR